MVYSSLSDIQDDLKMLDLIWRLVFHKFLLIVKDLHVSKADGWMSERRLQPGFKTAKLQSSFIAGGISQKGQWLSFVVLCSCIIHRDVTF